MLNNPPINELEKKAGSRYMLVSAVAKRARAKMEGNETYNRAHSKRKEAQDVRNTGEPVPEELIPDNRALDDAVEDFFDGEYHIKSVKSDS